MAQVITTPTIAAYSLRKLSTSYAGNAVQVRRGSDGATQNIGFAANGDLDTASLKNFVGQNNAYVAVWYDQSGNQSNASQPSQSQQPEIVHAGVIDRQNGLPTIVFSSSSPSNYLVYTKPLTTGNAPFTISFVAAENNNGGDLIGWGDNSGYGARAGLQFGQVNNLESENCASWGTALSSAREYLVSWTYDGSNLNSGLSSWLNGKNETLNRGYPTNNQLLNIHASGQTAIGEIPTTKNPYNGPYNGNISEIIVYPTVITTATRQLLECSELSYYNIVTTSVASPSLSVCGLVSPSLGGDSASAGIGAWSQVSGPGTTTFSNINSGNSKATASVGGVYVYKWSVSNGTCAISAASVTVTFISPVTDSLKLTGCNSVVYKSKTYTSSTIVRDTVHSLQGCDSIYDVVTITITPITPVKDSVALSGCNGVVYNGTTYLKSTMVRDTVRSKQGCDSVYMIANITVVPGGSVTKDTTITGCSSVVFNGKTYTASTVVHDTTWVNTCNVVYTVATINVLNIKPVKDTFSLKSCSSVVYKGKTYTASTTVRDTVRSVYGCDSIYNTVTITITSIKTATNAFTLSGCKSVIYKNKTYTSSTIVPDTVKSMQGCDSIYDIVTIKIAAAAVTKTTTLKGCGSVVYNNVTYTSSTVIRDTLRTTQGCDSLYSVVSITVNAKPNLGSDTTVFVCPGTAHSLLGLYKTTGYASVVWSTKRPDSAVVGTYTLIVAALTGCADTAVVTVAPLAAPPVPVITQTGKTTFCLGDSLALATTATGSLQWLRNGSPLKQATAKKYLVKLAGTYTVKVTNQAGCSAVSLPITDTVTVVPAPVITLVNDTLVSSDAHGNQWFESYVLIPSDTAAKYSPVNADIYSVQAIVQGCKSPMSALFFYTAGTKANKGRGNSIVVKLSPNPAANTARLEIIGSKAKVQVTLTDLAGKKVWQSAGQGDGVVMLPVHTLAPGTYVVTVFDGSVGRTVKLVVAR